RRRRTKTSPHLRARRPAGSPAPRRSPTGPRAVREEVGCGCRRPREASPSRACHLLLRLLLRDQLIEIVREVANAPLERGEPLARVLEILARHQPRGPKRPVLRLVQGLLGALQPADRGGDGLCALRILEELAHRLHPKLGRPFAQRLGRHFTDRRRLCGSRRRSPATAPPASSVARRRPCASLPLPALRPSTPRACRASPASARESGRWRSRCCRAAGPP